jgi:hypothetical protein
MALPAEESTGTDERSVYDQVHAQALRVPLAEMTNELRRLLTSRLVAYIAGVKDARTVNRWANGTIGDVRVESEKRLRAAYEIMALVLRFEGPGTRRAWFIGMDPFLGDMSPADAIHRGQVHEALGAARSFVAYG